MIGRAVNTLSKEIQSQSEKLESNTNSINQFSFLQREQNSNVANLQKQYNEFSKRQDSHDDWHGERDEELAKRLHDEEVEKARNAGKHEGYKTVLGIEYNVIKWLLGGGLVACGLALGKIIHIAGWW